MNQWDQVNAWRKARRSEIRSARAAIPAAERRACADAVAATLERAFPELAGAVLGFYWPLRGELDLTRFARRCAETGARAALPVVVERNRPVEFWLWEPGMKLEPGIWRIPVPRDRNPVHPTHLLVPLLGFDAAGYRLGNGGGYYDRTLATLAPRPFAIGVGQELGRLETVHPQAHDICLDALVTERGLQWPHAAAQEDGSDAGTTFSSPVCYAEDAAPEYFGYLTRRETQDLLQGLLADVRSGVRLAAALLRCGPSGSHAESLEDLRWHEALYCGTLVRWLRRMETAPPVSTTPVPPGQNLESPAAALRELMHRRVERLDAALPRIREEALHEELAALHAASAHALAGLRRA